MRRSGGSRGCRGLLRVSEFRVSRSESSNKGLPTNVNEPSSLGNTQPLDDPLAYLTCSSILEFKKNEVIYDPDHPSTNLYLIVGGKISQETLADIIGTTRSRVSFFLNRFRKLGFLDYNGGLHVHNSLLNITRYD